MTKLLPLALALVCAAVPSFSLQATGPDTSQAPPSASSASSDLVLIRDRYVLSVLPAQPSAIESVQAESAKYAAALQADGSWSDINYTDASRSVWANADHLDRLLVMAKSARVSRNAGRQDEALESKILLALKWWTDRDYHNTNWWWNEIGVPQMVGEIGVLLGPQLSPEAHAKIVAIMKRSVWRKWTGANLVWGVSIEIVRGCLENDPAAVAEGYDRLYQEIKIVSQPEDGIEQDNSFHQHGTQLYSGGYGLDFANDAGRFISYSWGTRYQVPPDRMAIFSAFLLDGEQWMIRGDVFDYSAVGREITRKEKVAVPHDETGGPIYPANAAAYGLGNTIALLAAAPTPRQKELQAFAARLKADSKVPEVTGNKQFWSSDFMAHRRKGFYTSVKMMSTRMHNGELVNSEGKKSQHLSDGVNFLYLTGNEYKDIFPAWDWTKLPGTTAIQGNLDTGEKDSIGLAGKTRFNGGVSDGTYGMAVMDLARGKLTAKKAWFFFDSSYVALGAGINLTGDSEHDVATDVNQALLVGDVVTSQSRQPVPVGTQTYSSPDLFWVYHNHVGYLFASDTKVNLSVGPQSGSWADIGAGPATPVTVPVFNLWIDHGRAPQDGTYQYTVFPNVTADETARRANSAAFNLSDISVLSNTENVQAVYDKGLKLIEVAFRQMGELKTPLGQIEVDNSCLLLVRQTAAGWSITASNPQNEPMTLNVAVKGSQVTIQLPGGNLAGSSVTAEVK
jgi:chondroitin AC lyase